MKNILLLLLTVSTALFAGPLPLSEEAAEKVEASHQWYLGFGPAFFSGMNRGGTGLGVEVARNWAVDSAQIRLAGDFAIKDSAFFANTGIGVNYLFLATDITPYAGAEFGFGVAKSQGDGALSGSTNGGFTLGFVVGVQLFQYSSVNVDVGVKGTFLLRETDHGHPQVFVVRVGLNI